MRIHWLILIWAFISTAVHANPIHGAAGWIRDSVLLMPDSLRTRVLAAIARGDIAGAVSLWELETGRNAPHWLQGFQAAFNAVNQRAGPCIQVARSVYEGFKQLGASPTYIQFTTAIVRRGDNLIGFELRAGEPRSTVNISVNAVHYVVRVGDRLYDAMTGPAGLTTAEYMQRLQSPGRLSMQTLSQLP